MPVQADQSSSWSITPLLFANTVRPISRIETHRQKLLYADSNSLWFDDQRIFLSASNGSSLDIQDLTSFDNKFYTSSSQGLFQNYRKIFNKGNNYFTRVTGHNIFTASEQALYQASWNKKKVHEQIKWTLSESSPQACSYFSLNPKKTKFRYAACKLGFYRLDNDTWSKADYGLHQNFANDFAFGRFLVKRSKSKEAIYLPSAEGVFYSNNQAQSWIMVNSGLKADNDGFFSIYDIKEFNSGLILASSTGLYYSESMKPQEIYWQPIVLNCNKDSFHNEHITSLKVEDEYFVVGTSQGQLFKISLSTQLETLKASIHDEYDLHIIAELLKQEPKIQDLQDKALAYSGIPKGKDFRKYKRQARLRHFLPKFEAYADKDSRAILSLQTSGGESFDGSDASLDSDFDRVNLDRDDDQVNTGLRLSWNLTNLIYDPEVNDINTSARITANIRENLLTELTQIYFRRQELLSSSLSGSQLKVDLKDKLRLLEYAAQLDARTGAWFSYRLKANIKKFINKLDDPLVQKQIKEIYNV